jgi:hypothetical protein
VAGQKVLLDDLYYLLQHATSNKSLEFSRRIKLQQNNNETTLGSELAVSIPYWFLFLVFIPMVVYEDWVNSAKRTNSQDTKQKTCKAESNTELLWEIQWQKKRKDWNGELQDMRIWNLWRWEHTNTKKMKLIKRGQRTVFLWGGKY